MFSLLCAIYDFVQPKRLDIFVVVPVVDYFPWFVFIYAFVQPKRCNDYVGDCWVWLCCIVSNICIFLCASFLSGVYLYIYSCAICMFRYYFFLQTFSTRRKVQPSWDFCFAFWFCWSTSLFFCLIFGRMVAIISWTSYFWCICFSILLKQIFSFYLFVFYWFPTMFSLLCAIYDFVQPKRFDIFVVVPVFDYFSWFVFIYVFVQPKRFNVSVSDCWDFCFAFWFCWSTSLFFLPYFWMDGCYYFLNLIFSDVYL